jgi:hypothetical protein
MSPTCRAASLTGTNLQGAKSFTQAQLDTANGDDRTILPEGFTRPAHWSKAEGNEGPPAAQPDNAPRTPASGGAPGPDK